MWWALALTQCCLSSSQSLFIPLRALVAASQNLPLSSSFLHTTTIKEHLLRTLEEVLSTLCFLAFTGLCGRTKDRLLLPWTKPKLFPIKARAKDWISRTGFQIVFFFFLSYCTLPISSSSAVFSIFLNFTSVPPTTQAPKNLGSALPTGAGLLRREGRMLWLCATK